MITDVDNLTEPARGDAVSAEDEPPAHGRLEMRTVAVPVLPVDPAIEARVDAAMAERRSGTTRPIGPPKLTSVGRWSVEVRFKKEGDVMLRGSDEEPLFFVRMPEHPDRALAERVTLSRAHWLLRMLSAELPPDVEVAAAKGRAASAEAMADERVERLEELLASTKAQLRDAQAERDRRGVRIDQLENGDDMGKMADMKRQLAAAEHLSDKLREQLDAALDCIKTLVAINERCLREIGEPKTRAAIEADLRATIGAPK